MKPERLKLDIWAINYKLMGKEKMYIGEKEIRLASEEGDMVNIIFKDNSKVEVHKELYGIIATKGKGNGTEFDVINHKLADKFLLDLAKYQLPSSMVMSLGQSMQTLFHNYRAYAFGSKFGKDHMENVTIGDILDEATKQDSDLYSK